MSNEENKWLEKLAVGDPVIVQAGNAYLQVDRLDTVEKITVHHIVVRGTKFRRASGWEIGDSLSGASLLQPTADRIEVIRRARLISRIEVGSQKDKLKALSTATLERLVALLAGEGEKEEA